MISYNVFSSSKTDFLIRFLFKNALKLKYLCHSIEYLQRRKKRRILCIFIYSICVNVLVFIQRIIFQTILQFIYFLRTQIKAVLYVFKVITIFLRIKRRKENAFEFTIGLSVDMSTPYRINRLIHT